jgi:hypothetical protein
VSEAQRAGRRSGPLSVRVGEADVMLTSLDATALIEGIEAWRRSLAKRLEESDKPETHEAATRRIGRLEQLEGLLVSAPSGLSDPPLELDDDQAKLVREALGELTGYQRSELSVGLRELRLTLSRLT